MKSSGQCMVTERFFSRTENPVQITSTMTSTQTLVLSHPTSTRTADKVRWASSRSMSQKATVTKLLSRAGGSWRCPAVAVAVVVVLKLWAAEHFLVVDAAFGALEGVTARGQMVVTRAAKAFTSHSYHEFIATQLTRFGGGWFAWMLSTSGILFPPPELHLHRLLFL